jgi:hypothetical protein
MELDAYERYYRFTGNGRAEILGSVPLDGGISSIGKPMEGA